MDDVQRKYRNVQGIFTFPAVADALMSRNELIPNNSLSCPL
jgi:hypothetical protein